MGTSLRMMRVVDSHTAGQPTRVIVDGGPHLGDGPLKERLQKMRNSHDRFRSIVVGEPRGSDALVGALLCQPSDPSCTTGVIFFDSSGYLGMCGHGIIGVVATLEYQGLIKNRGTFRIETPVGIVDAELLASGDVSIQNVPSFRHKQNVTVTVGETKFTGDVAFGGNWFYIINDQEDLSLARVERLTELTRSVRLALRKERVTGPVGEVIDCIALFGPPERRDARSRNFVQRFGKAYGRSPCGTSMSAKLACMFEDGQLAEGEIWRQESIIGTVFDGSVTVVEGAVRPTIRGNAYVTSEATLIIDDRDPLSWGIN